MVQSPKVMSPPFGLRILRTVTKILYQWQGTGLPRVAEYLRRRIANYHISTDRDSDYWISDFMGKAKLQCDLSDHMGSQIFFRGAYSLDQLNLIRKLFSVPFTFVDVGANQGEFSIFVASLSEKNRVLAFEPTLKMRTRLQQNLVGNGYTNVEVFDFGLSESSRDDVPIYGNSDVIEDGTFNAGLPTIHAMPGRENVIEHISLKTLDETMATAGVINIDLIKIDVEGEELSVLKGAQQTIESCRPIVIFEASVESAEAAGHTVQDLYVWLEHHKYVLHEIASRGQCVELRRDAPFCNVIGLPEEKAEAILRNIRKSAQL